MTQPYTHPEPVTPADREYEANYTKPELLEISDDLERCGVSALLAGERRSAEQFATESSHIRKQIVFAKLALRWGANEIETLRARVAELESQVANQAAQITGRHTYVGQDFTFRIERLQSQLDAANARVAELEERLAKALGLLDAECQFEAEINLIELKDQLATAQAHNAQLRKALQWVHETGLKPSVSRDVMLALTTTPDTGALDAAITEAEGMIMAEQLGGNIFKENWWKGKLTGLRAAQAMRSNFDLSTEATPDTSALDALRKDAERYRYLRNANARLQEFSVKQNICHYWIDVDHLDDTLDAAMKGEKG